MNELALLLCAEGKLLHCCLSDSLSRVCGTTLGVVPHADQQRSPWSSRCWSDVAVHRLQIRRLRGVHAASEIPFSALNPLLCCCSAVVSIYIPQSHFSGLKCVILCPTLIFWKKQNKEKNKVIIKTHTRQHWMTSNITELNLTPAAIIFLIH